MSDSDLTQRKDRRAGHALLRCPYCVEGIEFKIMVPRDERNGWYMCKACGHLAMPEQSDFKCRCAKCTDLDAKARLDRVAGMFRRRSLPD